MNKNYHVLNQLPSISNGLHHLKLSHMTPREDLALQALLNLPETNGGSIHESEVLEKSNNAFNVQELSTAATYLRSLGHDYLRIASSSDGSYYELLEEGRKYKQRAGR